MQAFKLYLKIMKRNVIWVILAFSLVYMVFIIVFSKIRSNPSDEVFEVETAKVAILDHDGGILAKELTAYLNEKTTPVKLVSEDETSLKDTLFFRTAYYILLIPEGFTDSFLSGNPLPLETMQVPDAAAATLVSQMVNHFLNTANLYLDAEGSIDYTKVKADLSLQAEAKKAESMNVFTVDNGFVNYMAYPILAILLFGVSTITVIMQEKNVKRRNYCSPVKISSFTMQQLLGNIFLAISVFLMLSIIAVILYPDLISIKGAFWLFNTFLFTMTTLSLSFFIANLTTKSNIWSIANIVSLGSCFMGGVFVPQSLLGEGVKKISVIFPSYWTVKANDTIGKITAFHFETLKPVFQCMIIEVAFICAFLSLTLLTAKLKRNK